MRHMSKMIQIRNVPEDVHREVKARAARAGMSLSDYLGREVARLVDAPTVEEIEARLAALPPVASEVDVVAELRLVRERRTHELLSRVERAAPPGLVDE